jgi:hypothetical protein
MQSFQSPFWGKRFVLFHRKMAFARQICGEFVFPIAANDHMKSRFEPKSLSDFGGWCRYASNDERE